MNVTEEMILLTIQKRQEQLKEYVNSDFNEFFLLSGAEKYINRIKPLVDDMYNLLKEYKKEKEEKGHGQS